MSYITQDPEAAEVGLGLKEDVLHFPVSITAALATELPGPAGAHLQAGHVNLLGNEPWCSSCDCE